MLVATLASLFERDLKRLKTEIGLYSCEENLWKTDHAITNSAGNLCLHLVGNLNTYIGKEIGKNSYTRNRELEFSLKNVPRAELLSQIEKTIDVVKASLEMLPDKELLNQYPVTVFEKPCTTQYLLVHLATHLGYHLGQINYHRRLLDK